MASTKSIPPSRKEAARLVAKDLLLPAYDMCLKCSHTFNLLDSRGAISVTERVKMISEIRALVSRNCANAERYRDRYHLNCAIETDADKAFKRNDVDVVVVCTPHNVHTQYVVAAAEAGKHIVIEKPPALTPEDVRQQRRAVEG